MTSPTNAAGFYADFSGMAALKKSAREQDPKALQEAARQFESVFTKMMLKSMRSASAGNSLGDSDQSNFYRDMFDDQLAVQMSKGRGIGLADMLVKQLKHAEGAATDAKASSDAALKLKMPTTRTTSTPIIAAGDQVNAPNTDSSAAHLSMQAKKKIEDYLQRMFGGASTAGDADSAAVQATATDAASKIDSSPVATVQHLAANAVEFVRQLWPHAKAIARELGVDPTTLIAHAALETGWGRSMPSDGKGNSSFNLFGIKAGASWSGAAVKSRTQEFVAGAASEKSELFRAYDSPADSFRDYAAMLKGNPRYAAALGAGTDTTKFANALQQGGYATDPSYAEKLRAVAAKVAGWLPGSGLTSDTVFKPDSGLKLSASQPITSRGDAF